MELIKEKVRIGELTRIPVGEGHQLTHQLFADDTRLFFLATQENFKCVKEIIVKYEVISGASLNLSKSMLVPLFLNGPIPKWMRNAGCKVVAKKEVINYLGCPIAYGVTPVQEAEFLLGKVRKRLGHWANRMLNWNGKIVLLRHVLRAIREYHLMALSLNQ